MPTIGQVFDISATGAPQTITLTVVSNQGDAICSYTVGSMQYLKAPSKATISVVPMPALFQRDHLVTSDAATMLFSDRFSPGEVSRQPFGIESPNKATFALAPSGHGDSSSVSWDVNLALPAPFNRTFNFAATVMGSTIVGTAPAIGISEHVDHATYVLSLDSVNAPK